MDEIDAKIRDTLLYIKANPECNTNPGEIDGHLIKDLYEQGLLDGSDAADLSSTTPEFIGLRVNLHGEKYLSLLLQPAEKNTSPPHWYSNPFLIAALSLFVFVVGSFIVWYADWPK